MDVHKPKYTVAKPYLWKSLNENHDRSNRVDNKNQQ
jgi:hypothetical protein